MRTLLPSFYVPAGTRVGFAATLNTKKSAKTTVARVIANEFSDAGYDLVILRHDPHTLLDCYAATTRIELARTAQVMSGRTSQDLTNHGPLNDALLSLADNPNRLVLLDGSAPGSERIGAILKAGRFNRLLPAMGVHAMFFVPMRPIHDSALGAVETMKELHAVMPDHYIVPVPVCDPEDLELLPADHPFFVAIEMARHGVITLPALAEDIARGLERLERPLTELADPDSEESLKYISQASGQSRLVSGMIAEGAQQLITSFEGAIAPLALARAE